MHSQTTAIKLTLIALAIPCMFLATRAFAAEIKGQVMGGGAPVVQSTVTLWAASSEAPKQLAQTKTDNEGRFEIRGATAPADASLYLVATGGEPGGKGRRQSGYRAVGGCGQQTPGRSRHQRVHHAGIGGHPRAVHRRRRDQGLAAAATDCRWQRAQLCGSRNRRLWRRPFWTLSTARRHPRWPTSPHYPSIMAALRHAGEVRCVQQSLLRGDVSNGGAYRQGHAGGRRVHRPLSLAPGLTKFSTCSITSIRSHRPTRPASSCGLRRSCRI